MARTVSPGGGVSMEGAGADASNGTLLHVRRMGLGEAAQRLVAEAEAFGYGTVATAPNRFRLARSVRPRGATIAACCTAPLLGLGLLLLLVRRTETCDAVVAEGRGGITVRLLGAVDEAFVARCRTMFSGDQPSPPASGIEPTPVVNSGRGMHVAEPAQVGLRRSFAGPAAAVARVPVAVDTVVRDAEATVLRAGAARWVLTLDDGRRLDLGTGLIVGRAPSRDQHRPDLAVAAIDDLSLSKSHALFGADARGAWVEDLHSTNGTTVVGAGGRAECVPGVRAVLVSGSIVEIGDRRLTVVAAGPEPTERGVR